MLINVNIFIIWNENLKTRIFRVSSTINSPSDWTKIELQHEGQPWVEESAAVMPSRKQKWPYSSTLKKWCEADSAKRMWKLRFEWAKAIKVRVKVSSKLIQHDQKSLREVSKSFKPSCYQKLFELNQVSGHRWGIPSKYPRERIPLGRAIE